MMMNLDWVCEEVCWRRRGSKREAVRQLPDDDLIEDGQPGDAALSHKERPPPPELEGARECGKRGPLAVSRAYLLIHRTP